MEIVDRVPQAIECEKAVLSLIIDLNRSLVDECIELGLKTEAFSTQQHRILYEAILRLHQRQEPVEPVSLIHLLSEESTLELCGGIGGVGLFINTMPRADSVEYYVRSIQKAARRRELFRACNLAQTLLLEEDEESVSEAERMLQTAMLDITPNKLTSMEDLLYRYLADLETREEAGSTALGIGTGFHDYDLRTHGLQRGELVVLAARPSNGKTTLAMNWAENVSKTQHSAAVFSLEMSSNALAEKMLSRTARIDSYRLRGGFFSKTDWHSFQDAVGRFRGVRLNLCDECGLNASQIKARARRMVSQGLDVVFVDFLQLMTGSKKDQNRFELVGENAREMKNLARDLNISVVLLSQLNRSIESRSDPEPQLSDLRESGEIEQVADVIAFLYHEKTDDESLMTMKLGKNRNGAQGSFKLAYHRPVNRFETLTQ